MRGGDVGGEWRKRVERERKIGKGGVNNGEKGRRMSGRDVGGGSRKRSEREKKIGKRADK